MEYITTAWNWLMKSSVDPAKTALTVKGFLTAVIPYFVLISGVLNHPADAGTLTTLVEALSNVVLNALTVVGTVVSLIGLFRKLVLTVQ